MQTPIPLPDKTLSFAKLIGDAWTQPDGMGMREFQERFLYSQTLGAARTAKSYWILRSKGQDFDAQVLARCLLERIFSSRVAKIEPRYAVEMIASEIDDRIQHQKKWISSHGDATGDKAAHLHNLQSDLKMFLALLEAPTVPKWDYYRRAKKAGVSWAYRSAYSEFSRFVHTGYDVTAFRDECALHVSDYLAFVAPIDTALWLYHCSTGGSTTYDHAYSQLFSEIQVRCWGNSTIEDRADGSSMI